MKKNKNPKIGFLHQLLHGIISSPLMTQGGQPCKQHNSAQGGPPCASYLLRRAVRPPTSKTVRRADRPVHHISYTGRTALQPAKQCAGQTALCIISTPAIQGLSSIHYCTVASKNFALVRDRHLSLKFYIYISLLDLFGPLYEKSSEYTNKFNAYS